MKKGQLISICIIIFGVITGFAIYYYSVNPEERIFIESYDRTVEFELGSYEVESITNNVNDFSNNTSFKVDNEVDFVSSVITSNESFVGTLNYTVGESESAIYYFLEDSYCYYVRPYGDNEFVLMTCSTQFTTNDYSAEIPFIPFAYVEYDVEYEYSDMNSSNFLAFQDYIDFFENLNDDQILIDINQEKIEITPFDLWGNAYDTNKKIVMTFDNEGFTITLE